ncbi:hypothetical protein D7B24_008283 [Verticillium nonalfalfae]|uniref:AA1-like domain-containing protein n=1 Tax=Verticillium nonalfalfae TaxID=1051616 RepID=A0A3M9Y5V7_9PEZI|nr:uncharacterized protein D7B24_008283 [Verticillium nonalfalfae]RNJ55661.1 hypothetical protein D7B24_008283 [Verticillium nonalfalfae]
MYITRLFFLLPLVAAMPTLDMTPGDGPTPRYPWLNVTFADLKVGCTKPGPTSLYSCTMQFNFHDPNSALTQEVNDAFCKVSWDWDGTSTVQGPGNNYPDGFTICSVALYNSFQVQINAFLSASNWQMTVSHKYKDNVHFKEPWVLPNSFTQVTIPGKHPDVSQMPVAGHFFFEAMPSFTHHISGLS